MNVRVVFALGLAILAAVAAGCGGSKSPSVASLGATTPSTSTTTTNTTGSGLGEPGPATSTGSGSGGLHSLVAGGATVEQRTQYAACMRENGVPNFPDPDAEGHFSISPTSGLDPRSATFQHAQQSCQRLLPDTGAPSPAQEAQTRTELLTLAQCLRNHGYPNFPDPSSQATFEVTGASGIDPSSSQFHLAMSACHTGNGKVPVSIGIQATSPPPGGKP